MSWKFKKVFESTSNSHSEVTFVVTVFNQVEIIHRVLLSISEMSSKKFDLVIIDDCSTDGTSAEVVRFLESISNPKLSCFNQRAGRLASYKSRLSFFETECDNYGILKSETDMIVLIQSDIEITELNFDEKMYLALKSSPDLFMISGRGVADENVVRLESLVTRANPIRTTIVKLARRVLRVLGRKEPIPAPGLPEADREATTELFESIFPYEEKFLSGGTAGWRGQLLDLWNQLPERQTGYPNKIWIGQYVMRGPIAFMRERYNLLGGFDRSAFFLGFDDLDLCLKARSNFGWRVGFVPISFNSPMAWGTTRKKRSYVQMFLVFLWSVSKARKFRKSTLWAHKMGKSPVALATPEILEY
jgi:glycosyltransferase involved in cell wall biosynthesis